MKPYNERCWINGYEWGVEYEANGEKPNLPDDVEVEWASHAQWVRVDKVCNLEWGKSDPYCVPITKFRIVDERYKPKEQEMNNDWYEKGELPPVGSKAKYKIDGEIYEVEVIAYHGEGGKLRAWVYGRSNGYLTAIPSWLYPLRTETDKLVEEAMSLFDASEYTSGDFKFVEEVVVTLVEKGYRKTKQMSEDEFVQSARKYFEYFDSLRFDVGKMRLICESLRKLHSAGCRFIDKGE